LLGSDSIFYCFVRLSLTTKKIPGKISGDFKIIASYKIAGGLPAIARRATAGGFVDAFRTFDVGIVVQLGQIQELFSNFGLTISF